MAKKVEISARQCGKTEARIVKLETAVRAGLALRKAIEPQHNPPLKALLVPAEAVQRYDKIIEDLK